MLVAYLTPSTSFSASRSFSTDVIERFSFVGAGQGVEQGGKTIYDLLLFIIALAQS
jgi:hypothetical protein